MNATCILCGFVARVERSPLLINPGLVGDDPATLAAVQEISEFDLLAGRMMNHIGSAHREHTLEMTAVMHLAAKVYAMTWAEAPGDEPNYSALREAWRKGVLQQMNTTTVAATDVVTLQAEAADAPGVAGNSAAAPPSGSNVKKSVRNASN
jgi:hypothetical protein